MRHGVVAAVLLVAAAGVFQMTSAEEKKPIVAVFGIEAKDVKLKPSVLASLTHYLASKLSESGKYEVVPQDKLAEALAAKKKESYRQCYNQSCQIAIGQELAASKALATQVMKVGTKCTVTVNLYDLAKKTSGKAATAKGLCSEDGIQGSVDEVVSKLAAKQAAPTPTPLPAPTPPARTPAPVPGRDPSPMVKVPAGSFLRGSREGVGEADERPQRSIHLDAFEIDKHQVSVAQYWMCIRAGTCATPDTGRKCNWGEVGREHYPINCVTWEQARSYCSWAGKRLPTEAEWEKAARGTDGRKYPWGNAEPDCNRATFENCHGKTVPVTWFSNAASPYGAVQMAGNVWQWTADWYGRDYYGKSPARNPSGPSSGTVRVVRGGAWSDFAEGTCAAYRSSGEPSLMSDGIGFRCVRGTRR